MHTSCLTDRRIGTSKNKTCFAQIINCDLLAVNKICLWHYIVYFGMLLDQM